MAINSDNKFWNLLEIVETENGITKLPNEYKVNGKYNFLDYKNVYSKETLTDFKHNNLPKINIFEKDKNKFYTSKQNFIAVTWSSETNKDVFQATFIETVKPFILNGFSKLLCVKKEYNVLPKWLTWYLNYDFSIQKQRESIPYTTRCNMTKNEMKNIKIKKVPLNIQQSIINIIEPFEKLKMNIESKINKLIHLTKMQLDNTKINDYKLGNFSFFQGFPFSSSDFVSDGKYKIFKIANITNLYQNVVTTNNLKSDILLKESDVVTGLSGSIGTSSIIIHNDIFLLNQRLISIKSKYPLLIKMIIEKNKKNLESLSTGSVQMNITKNDILNLKYDSSLNTEFNYLISKKYINYSKQIFLIDLIIKKLIELYVV